MVKLSELKKICAEREAALSDEERSERDLQHKETLEQYARQHERMFAPIDAMERALAPVRSIEKMLAPMRGIQELLSLAENPALRLAQEEMDNPTARLMRDFVYSPTLRLAMGNADRFRSVDLPNIHVPSLASLDHLTALTRDLKRDVTTPFCPDPMLFRAPKRPRDADQDERFEKLSAVVVAQTKEIVELRVDMQRVRESAAGDAERERNAVARRERKETWMRLVLIVVASVLSALATRLI